MGGHKLYNTKYSDTYTKQIYMPTGLNKTHTTVDKTT